MKVFKFGGASVKDAKGVRNLVQIVKDNGLQNTLIVVSAMGKMTNAFEEVVAQYMITPKKTPEKLLDITAYHFEIIEQLFEPQAQIGAKEQVSALLEDLKIFLKRNKSPKQSFVYDQVVSHGELLSTQIIQQYFQEQGLESQWIDARDCVKTDAYYRDANLDWEATKQAIDTQIKRGGTYITQGFIGSDANNNTTTLGREGSDYSAAIFAYALQATSVTSWKDVPGVLNADPRIFNPTQLLLHISYREAIELAYYGASVIHPKTIQPLQRKEIPLFVKPFNDPKQKGTVITKGHPIVPQIPCFIVKQEQVLIELASRDFSFIIEENISEIFQLMHQYQMKVELIQNSAISFLVCVSNKYGRLEGLVNALQAKFNVQVVVGVALYTIRHFNQTAIDRIKNNEKKILLEQRTQETIQFVVASPEVD